MKEQLIVFWMGDDNEIVVEVSSFLLQYYLLEEADERSFQLLTFCSSLSLFLDGIILVRLLCRAAAIIR